MLEIFIDFYCFSEDFPGLLASYEEKSIIILFTCNKMQIEESAAALSIYSKTNNPRNNRSLNKTVIEI